MRCNKLAIFLMWNKNDLIYVLNRDWQMNEIKNIKH